MSSHHSLPLPSALSPSSLPVAMPSSFLHWPSPSIQVPSSPPRLSLTSLSCSTVLSACTFLICSKHLSRKLWGRELVGPRGAAAPTSQSASYHSISCRAESRQGVLRRQAVHFHLGPPQPLCHSSLSPPPPPVAGTLTDQLHGALGSRLSQRSGWICGRQALAGTGCTGPLYGSP